MLTGFVVLTNVEGFGGVVGAHHVGGVEDVAEFIASEAVEFGVAADCFTSDWYG
jgi:hypothetical protein